MVHLGIRKDNPDYYALEVMNEVFGGGFSARLFSNVRTKKGLAYNVGGGVGSQYDHPGLFRSRWARRAIDGRGHRRALRRDRQHQRPEPITDDELRRAKDSILNSFIFKYDSKEKVLSQQLMLAFYGYPADFLEKYRTAIEKVTADDVSGSRSSTSTRTSPSSSSASTPTSTRRSSKYGKVTPIDITIPDPGAPKQTAARRRLGEGKALMMKVVEAMGGGAEARGPQELQDGLDAQRQGTRWAKWRSTPTNDDLPRQAATGHEDADGRR